MTDKTGGPAFPRTREELRDYFAGQALVGYLSDDNFEFTGVQEVAQHAYKFADAMLAERDK